MPGQYGRQWYPCGGVDAPVVIKPARSGPCVCGRMAYRERFTVGSGWQWRCNSCEPEMRIERRVDTKKRAMGYVPSQYDPGGEADRVAAKLQSGDFVAKRPDGSVVDGWTPQRAST